MSKVNLSFYPSLVLERFSIVLLYFEGTPLPIHASTFNLDRIIVGMILAVAICGTWTFPVAHLRFFNLPTTLIYAVFAILDAVALRFVSLTVDLACAIPQVRWVLVATGKKVQ